MSVETLSTQASVQGAQGVAKSDFEEDLARYPRHARWVDRSLWAIWTYRLGRNILQIRGALTRRLLLAIYLLFDRLMEMVTKISLPVYANIGPGLKIVRGGMIIVHANATLGRNCTLHQGVTIGNTGNDDAVPIVGDGVEFEAYAQALGGIRIGDGATVSSMSVLLVDVPPAGVAIGIPAKVFTKSQAAARLRRAAYDPNGA